jgi:hypothetical protein
VRFCEYFGAVRGGTLEVLLQGGNAQLFYLFSYVIMLLDYSSMFLVVVFILLML